MNVENTANGMAWYCLRTQSHREGVAVDSLQRLGSVEPFLPRIRMRRVRNRKLIWRSEALFPGYLFARFDLGAGQRAVGYANGVTGIVHFGAHWPVIPPEFIDEMRALDGGLDLPGEVPVVHPGDRVGIVNGPMEGFLGTVVRVATGGERVALLLDFLGQQSTVEVPVWELRHEPAEALAAIG